MELNYLLLIFSIFAITNIFAADETLLSVVQVFRHGERTPTIFYPTDPYRDSSYWDGLGTGQLTENGKQQLVELGQYFRNRYGDFLSTEYSSNEIYITSVTSKRNQLSAEAFLTGLYPNQDTSSIPVQTTPVAVMGGLIECLRYNRLYVELEFQNEHFKNVNKENEDVYTYVRQNSVFPVFELLGAHSIWDTLSIEARVNYTLPEWTESVYPEKLTNLTNEYALSLCYTEEQQQLITGAFLNEIIQNFENIIEGSSSTRKVRLYSGHDANLACFLNTFDAFTPHNPDFASSIILELKQNNGVNYINAYYKPDDEALPISLRGCDFNCSFEDFKSLFKDVVITEIEWVEKCFTFL